MNRAQFMEQLKKLLSDISEEERQEALDYYESYFDDAAMMAKTVLLENYSYKLQPYFKEKYYDKLKEHFEQKRQSEN